MMTRDSGRKGWKEEDSKAGMDVGGRDREGEREGGKKRGREGRWRRGRKKERKGVRDRERNEGST